MTEMNMMHNRDIIIFGDDWGRYPSTIQHIGKILAKNNRIIWVGSLGLRKPKFSFYDLNRIIEKGMKWFRTQEKMLEQKNDVFPLNPFVIPFHDSRIIYRLNMYLLKKSVLRLMQKLQYKNVIVITSSPIVGGVIGELGERSSHYFCLDDFTLFDGAFDSMRKLEQDLIGKVDSVFAISDTLSQSRNAKNGVNFLLPQGVDNNHFSPNGERITNDLATIKKPIIGFFGLLTYWVDLELIKKCAEHYPAYSFVVIGKTHIDVNVLLKSPNIHYLGEVPFVHLPLYARHFDVGIIPFIINDLTIACNPLKLLEYFSLGIPVVSTNMPEVAKFKPHVIIAKTESEFIESLREAVDDISVEKNKQRRLLSEKYSWQTISEDVLRKIDEIEIKKMK